MQMNILQASRVSRPAKSDLFLVALIKVAVNIDCPLTTFYTFVLFICPLKRAAYCLVTTSEMKDQRGEHGPSPKRTVCSYDKQRS